jgi:hypothetical protein
MILFVTKNNKQINKQKLCKNAITKNLKQIRFFFIDFVGFFIELTNSLTLEYFNPIDSCVSKLSGK